MKTLERVQEPGMVTIQALTAPPKSIMAVTNVFVPIMAP